jgi:hypothetical protein
MIQMKILFTLLISICSHIEGHGQITKSNLSDSCSNIFDKVSYFWKNDSLANNGFRLYAYDRLLKCKLDGLTTNILFDKLGKPNEIWKSNQGIDYVYYFFDTKALPRKFGKPVDCGYIYFSFAGKGEYITSIGHGVLDY